MFHAEYLTSSFLEMVLVMTWSKLWFFLSFDRVNNYGNTEDVYEALSSCLHYFTEDGGVLIFIYSIILTKVG